MSAATPPKEIISPEGVEERLVAEVVYRITLTGGGKYRTYCLENGKVIDRAPAYDTREEADVSLGGAMTMRGMFMVDREATIKVLLEDLRKKKS